MGDFQLPFKELKRDLGLQVVPYDPPGAPAADEVATAVSQYRSAFPDSDCSDEVLERSVRVELAVRAWAKREQLRGMSFNFGDVTEENGFETVPFLAAGALMAEGIGYAGEGDVLTAALVGALSRAYPDTTFSEMFCPDWDGGRIYMAHMGEANHRVLTGPPQILEMDYKFSATNNPAYASGRLRPGPACIVNAVPLGDGDYRLIVAEGEMCDVTGEDRFAASVHGWFRPSLAVPDFLEAYSNVGGTHHLAVAYNARVEELEAFAVFMGWDIVEIR
jgi:L-arabinose isomerase